MLAGSEIGEGREAGRLDGFSWFSWRVKPERAEIALHRPVNRHWNAQIDNFGSYS
jgi:hypothetical protein